MCYKMNNLKVSLKTALKTIELISAINKIPFDIKAAINRFALTKIEPSIEEAVRILKILKEDKKL